MKIGKRVQIRAQDPLRLKTPRTRDLRIKTSRHQVHRQNEDWPNRVGQFRLSSDNARHTTGSRESSPSDLASTATISSRAIWSRYWVILGVVIISRFELTILEMTAI